MRKIYIGEHDKKALIENYVKENQIEKIYVLGDDVDIEAPNKENIIFKEVIMYKYFYRLLQEIDKNTLIVLNECLQKENRYCLEYNCIRHYLQLTGHILVFNYYPIIEHEEDFAILMDFASENPFLKEPYRYMTNFQNVEATPIKFDITVQRIVVDEKHESEYEELKNKTIAEVRKDPNIIPRRLLRFSEKLNKKQVKQFDSLSTKKHQMNVVINQLKVDEWYYNDLLRWKGEIENVINKVLQRECA